MVSDSPRLRLGVIAVVVVSLFAALFGRLWYLQVVAAPTFEAAAEANQLRTIVIPPLRGRILDAQGRVLAKNKKEIVVTVDRRAIRNPTARRELFTALAPVVGKTVEQLEQRWNSDRYDRLLPLPVLETDDETLAIYLKERSDDFPGVDVREVATRVYPYGPVAAHVIGYVGKVTPEAVAQEQQCPLEDKKLCRYQLSDVVGKDGVERLFEQDLRGVPGYQRLEVDARGRVIRVVEDVPPIPGHDVQLTIDVELQAFVERTLAQGLAYTRLRSPRNSTERFQAPAGAVVVQDPTTGAILASASYPTYDPREFVGGISQERFAQLTAPGSFDPLFNRVTKGQYAPGSTFKVVTGLAGVEGGLRGVFDTFLDTPQYISPDSKDQRVFGSPTEASFGEIDLAKALMVSSDSFFYSIGNDLWAGRGTNPRALQQVAEELGFGAPTGVQLPGESGGRMASPEVKQALHDRYQDAFPEPRYFFGDNILAAIGQGILTVTPLQLANAYSAIANGGTLYSPNIASAVYEANTFGTLEPVLVRELGPRVLRRITFPEGYRDAVIRGLEGVVRNPLGTAYEVFQTYPADAIPVVGKTGTAQDFTKKSERDNSLFAAFGPPDRPRYTVVAVMERSGFGSQAAAPVVRHVFEALSNPALIPRLEEAPPLGVEPPDAVPAAPLPGSPPIGSAGERD